MPNQESGWVVEHGIGETRALLIEDNQVAAAKLRWPGELAAGSLVTAKLAHVRAGSSRGVAIGDTGHEILLDKLPRSVAEGSMARVMITRAPIAERGRLKRAQGRIAQNSHAPEVGPMEGRVVRKFPAGLWEEVWSAASSGEIDFPGGSILLSVTPAMTLIDIDGEGTPRELSLAAIPAIAQALQWFDIGGSIGIDFPTISSKADRKAVDASLDEALDGWPHERTAMNGFGFVQLVARLEGPSLLHRFAHSRVGASARMALRRAEMIEEAGRLLLTVHPALKAKIKEAWLIELAGRSGREVQIATDPSLAIDAGFAQAMPR